jgi:hypothetical protein
MVIGTYIVNALSHLLSTSVWQKVLSGVSQAAVSKAEFFTDHAGHRFELPLPATDVIP